MNTIERIKKLFPAIGNKDYTNTPLANIIASNDPMAIRLSSTGNYVVEGKLEGLSVRYVFSFGDFNGYDSTLYERLEYYSFD